VYFSAIVGALLSLGIATATHAALVDDINDLRTKGCGNQPVAQTPLRANRELDAVAREWSNGGRLREALAKMRYPATSSASMRVEGSADDALILKVLAANYCESITGRDFTEIGVLRRDQIVWIVLAARLSPPAAKDSEKISGEVLALVNQARSQPRRCGTANFAATRPLTLSAGLARAALMQAQDMAAHDNFEHVGTDGSTPSQRVTRAGYQWRSVAENIARGAATAQEVMQDWLTSPGHCANIMNPRSTQMGVAYAVNLENGIYWAQVFAAPQ
jgi:uncharacterized protein YkwD